MAQDMEFWLDTLCFEFLVSNGQVIVDVRDSEQTQTYGLPLILSVVTDNDGNRKLAVRQGNIDWDDYVELACICDNQAFKVTKGGGGVGIADIRDGLRYSDVHLFDLAQCPVLLSRPGSDLIVKFPVSEGRNPNLLVPRPNYGYDFFNINTSECE